MSIAETPVEQPTVYENEHGVPCLAPYVPVYNMTGTGTTEVGAIVKGQRFDMSEVMGLDSETLAEEGVMVPSRIVSRIHEAAAERTATESNVISLELRRAA